MGADAAVIPAGRVACNDIQSLPVSIPMALTTRQNQPLKPRPPQLTSDASDVNRSEVITLRVTPEEREAWQAAADADQRKLADWIRIAVNASLKTDTAPRKKGGR